MRRHLSTPLSLILHRNFVGVNRIPLVGIHGDTEEAGVRLEHQEDGKGQFRAGRGILTLGCALTTPNKMLVGRKMKT